MKDQNEDNHVKWSQILILIIPRKIKIQNSTLDRRFSDTTHNSTIKIGRPKLNGQKNLFEHIVSQPPLEVGSEEQQFDPKQTKSCDRNLKVLIAFMAYTQPGPNDLDGM